MTRRMNSSSRALVGEVLWDRSASNLAREASVTWRLNRMAAQQEGLQVHQRDGCVESQVGPVNLHNLRHKAILTEILDLSDQPADSRFLDEKPWIDCRLTMGKSAGIHGKSIFVKRIHCNSRCEAPGSQSLLTQAASHTAITWTVQGSAIWGEDRFSDPQCAPHPSSIAFATRPCRGLPS